MAGVGLFQVVFADDNICVIELLRGPKNNSCGFEIRQKIDKFLSLWEKILNKAGMLLNQTKTEVLSYFENKDRYPPIKTEIKWLGIMLKMNENSAVVPDVDLNIKNIKKKSIPQFAELCLLTSRLAVRLKIFKVFIESIIDYALVACLATTKNHEKAAQEFQKLQNLFLRKLAQVSCRAGTEALHTHLGVRMIDYKVKRLANSEFKKCPFMKNYSLVNISKINRESVFQQKTLADRIYKLATEFKNTETKKMKVDLRKCENWISKIQQQTYHIVASSEKLKSHNKEMENIEKQLQRLTVQEEIREIEEKLNSGAAQVISG